MMAWLFFALGVYLLSGVVAKKWPEVLFAFSRKPTATPGLNLTLGIICLLIGWGITALPDMSEDRSESASLNQVATPPTSQQPQSTKPGEVKITPKQEPATQRSAPRLLAAYHANEVAADQKYKGQVIRVMGRVLDINKDFWGGLNVRLGGDEFGLMTVICYFDKKHEDALARLKKGDMLRVDGKCAGMVLGSVSLYDCRL